MNLFCVEIVTARILPITPNNCCAAEWPGQSEAMARKRGFRRYAVGQFPPSGTHDESWDKVARRCECFTHGRAGQVTSEA